MSDLDRVAHNLFVGKAPPCGGLVGWPLDTVVLTAMEYQPPSSCFPGMEVLRANLDDSGAPILEREVREALTVGAKVSRRLRRGKAVLVTCAQGRNRSGMVAAIALIMAGADANEAITRIRKARGPMALSNPAFVRVVQAVALQKTA